MADDDNSQITALTVELLSAYLSKNAVAPEALTELIRSTRAVLSEPDAAPPEAPEPEAPVPAVSVRKSIANPEHILSLIDGKPYKTLKRHLARHGLTPEAYRERYSLPAHYPMVAPAFAEKRRDIAKAIGLGGGKTPVAVIPAASASEPQQVKTPEVSASEVNADSPAPAKSAAKTTSMKTTPKKTKLAAAKAAEKPADETAPATPSTESAATPVTKSTAKPKAAAKPKAEAKPKPKPKPAPKATVEESPTAQPVSAPAKPKRAKLKLATPAPETESLGDATEASTMPAEKPSAAKTKPAPRWVRPKV